MSPEQVDGFVNDLMVGASLVGLIVISSCIVAAVLWYGWKRLKGMRK